MASTKILVRSTFIYKLVASSHILRYGCADVDFGIPTSKQWTFKEEAVDHLNDDSELERPKRQKVALYDLLIFPLIFDETVDGINYLRTEANDSNTQQPKILRSTNILCIAHIAVIPIGNFQDKSTVYHRGMELSFGIKVHNDNFDFATCSQGVNATYGIRMHYSSVDIRQLVKEKMKNPWHKSKFQTKPFPIGPQIFQFLSSAIRNNGNDGVDEVANNITKQILDTECFRNQQILPFSLARVTLKVQTDNSFVLTNVRILDFLLGKLWYYQHDPKHRNHESQEGYCVKFLSSNLTVSL